nr:hypothetical protein GCM10020092_046200 [Actinoplanes digitatis]
MFLKQLARAVPGLRVVAAGRARPRSGFTAGRVWTLPGLDDHDGVLLLRRLTGTDGDQELMLRVVRATAGDPLSLHLAADVLRRTGSDPARLIAIGEGDVRGGGCTPGCWSTSRTGARGRSRTRAWSSGASRPR